MNGGLHVRAARGRRSTLFRGPAHILVPTFKALNARRQWDSRERGWLVPNTIADDVVAYLEQRGGVLVDLEQVVA